MDGLVISDALLLHSYQYSEGEYSLLYSYQHRLYSKKMGPLGVAHPYMYCTWILVAALAARTAYQ